MDNQLTQHPSEARHCREPAPVAITFKLQPLCAELYYPWMLTAMLLHLAFCHSPVPCFHPHESKPRPRASGVSLFCLPVHRKRGITGERGGALTPAELGTASKLEERWVGGWPEQHFLSPYLSLDSQMDHSPSISATKDYESLH